MASRRVPPNYLTIMAVGREEVELYQAALELARVVGARRRDAAAWSWPRLKRAAEAYASRPAAQERRRLA